MDLLAGDEKPHIVVGTPGRILELVRKKVLKLDHVKRFVLDECDKLLDSLGGCVARTRGSVVIMGVGSGQRE